MAINPANIDALTLPISILVESTLFWFLMNMKISTDINVWRVILATAAANFVSMFVDILIPFNQKGLLIICAIFFLNTFIEWPIYYSFLKKSFKAIDILKISTIVSLISSVIIFFIAEGLKFVLI